MKLLIAVLALVALAGCEKHSEPVKVAIVPAADSAYRAPEPPSWPQDTTSYVRMITWQDTVGYAVYRYIEPPCLECKMDSLLAEVRALRESLEARP